MSSKQISFFNDNKIRCGDTVMWSRNKQCEGTVKKTKDGLFLIEWPGGYEMWMNSDAIEKK